MGKTPGHEELAARVCVKLKGGMLAKGRRRAAQIDRDVKDAARKNADELGLGVRGNLEMQAADRADMDRKRLVILAESNRKRLGRPSLGKPAAAVREAARRDKLEVGNVHARSFSTRAR